MPNELVKLVVEDESVAGGYPNSASGWRIDPFSA